MDVGSRVEPSTQFRDTGVMAIFRAPSADRFVDVAKVLLDAGVTCMEVTLTTPGALDAIQELRRQLPADADVGAGTVITAAQVHAAVEAGAGFVVSPSTEPDVLAAAGEAGIASYPGALSPTEVLAAWRGGASAVKLFPAAAVSPRYVKDLAGPFPDIAIVPTGGVDLDSIGAWIRAGVVGVGLGGPLFGDSLAGGDLEALASRAQRALAQVAQARAGLP